MNRLTKTIKKVKNVETDYDKTFDEIIKMINYFTRFINLKRILIIHYFSN